MNETHRQLADNASEYAVAAMKLSPGVAVTATAAAGWDWNIAVLIATFVFMILQIGHLLWKWRRDARDEGKADG